MSLVITYSKKKRKHHKHPQPAQEVREATKKCVFCHSDEENEEEYGKIITDKKSGLTVHYYCMLFASGLCQRGKSDQDGILGFLPKDIHMEVRRGTRLRCFYCREKGATIGCVIRACRKAFHLTCGKKAGSLHQFFDTYRSYCHDHRLKQTVPYSDRLAFFGTANTVCAICLTAVEARTSNDTLRTPCCRNSWFHKLCIQRYASSAGLHFFKCPLCNNCDTFQAEMLKFGICIPDQDAAWEQEPGAYNELLQRYNHCDAAVCKCPQGRSYNRDDSEWEIILCDWCGSSASHSKCGGLRRFRRDNICRLCADIHQRKKSSKETEQPSSTKKRSSQKTQEQSRLKKRRRSSNSASTSASASVSTSDEEEVDVVGIAMDPCEPHAAASSSSPSVPRVQHRRGLRKRRGVHADASPPAATGNSGPASTSSHPGSSSLMEMTGGQSDRCGEKRGSSCPSHSAEGCPCSDQPPCCGQDGSPWESCPLAESPGSSNCIIGRRKEDADKETVTIFYSGHKFTINKQKKTGKQNLTVEVESSSCSDHEEPKCSSQRVTEASRGAAERSTLRDDGPPRLIPIEECHAGAAMCRMSYAESVRDVEAMCRGYEPMSRDEMPDILRDVINPPRIRITRSAVASASATSSLDAAEVVSNSSDSSSSRTTGSQRRSSTLQAGTQRLMRSMQRAAAKAQPPLCGEPSAVLTPVVDVDACTLPCNSCRQCSFCPDSVITVSSSDSDVEIENVAGTTAPYVKLRQWRSTSGRHFSYVAHVSVNDLPPSQPRGKGNWERIYLPTEIRERDPEDVVPMQLLNKGKPMGGPCPHSHFLRSFTPQTISSESDSEVEVVE